MSESNSVRQTRPNLLPHQTAFIDKFFEDGSKRCHLLQSDVGLGSSFMAAHLVERAMATTPDARVLVLTPKALQAQMRSVLHGLGVRVAMVDRFRYRQMQDNAPAHSTVWDTKVAFVLSLDFAKQEDIMCSLASVPWTLLVVDEAHLFRRGLEELVRRIRESSPDIRMMFISLPDMEVTPTLRVEAFTTTRWHGSDIVDHAGNRMFLPSRAALEMIEFLEEAAEIRVRDAVATIAHLLGTSRNGTFLGWLLFRSLGSSPAALEEGVRRLRHRITYHETLTHLFSDDEADDETDIDDLSTVTPENGVELLTAVDRCLAELESLDVDSKLSALVSRLAAVGPGQDPNVAICILTDYLATLFYLQTHLEEAGHNLHVLHGRMSFDERAQTADRFRQQGGVLLGTTAMMAEGFSLQQVEVVILYDIPRSPLMAMQIYGRFQRFGRTRPLKVCVLYGDQGIESAGAKSLDKLKEIIADDGN